MSAIVTGTGVRVWGVKVLLSCAIAVTRSAIAATTVAKASTNGREPGRMTGRRNPNLGRAAGAERTRLNAEATSTLRSGALMRLEMAPASLDTALNRAWHSTQDAKWRASAEL